MTTLTNFNNFELNTNEKENVNGGCGYGTGGYSVSNSYSNSYSSSNCYPVSYSNSCSNCYTSCEPAEKTVVQAAPVIETPTVIETLESLTWRVSLPC